MPTCYTLQVPFSMKEFFDGIVEPGGRTYDRTDILDRLVTAKQVCISTHLKHINVSSLTPAHDGSDKEIEKQLAKTCVHGDYINVFIRLDRSNSTIETIVSNAGIQTNCGIPVTGVTVTSASSSTLFNNNSYNFDDQEEELLYEILDDSDLDDIDTLDSSDDEEQQHYTHRP